MREAIAAAVCTCGRPLPDKLGRMPYRCDCGETWFATSEVLRRLVEGSVFSETRCPTCGTRIYTDRIEGARR